MGCGWLIPTEVQFVPNELAAARAVRELSCLGLVDGRLSVNLHDAPKFFLVESGLVAIACPHCGAQVSLDWWSDEMNRAWDSRHKSLDTVLPCCGSPLSLNELSYEPPAGFAQFSIGIDTGESPPEDVLKTVSSILGCTMRFVPSAP